nr:uncharacterized protein C19orf47 homolog isoform X1 [Taeniopygia guttata]
MATSEWLRFFEDAGIPPGPALGYAVAFVDNRIHKDMLLELTKELMKDLGVTAVGDVIAILRHARLVHRQEMCRAASEALRDQVDHRDRRDRRDWGHQDHWDQEQRDHRDRDLQDQQDQDHRDQRDPRDLRDQRDRDQRDPVGAAGRMIANSLSRDPAPRNPPGAGICVTVPNGAGGSGPTAAPAAPRQRRVTAAAPGRYRIPRIPRIPRISRISPPQAGAGRQILRQIPPAAPAPARPSVFERLGAEAKAATGKPSGVFGRLGAAPESSGDPSGDPQGDPSGDQADPEALPYAGVLKRRRDGSAAMQDGAVSSSSCGSSCGGSASRSSCGSRSVFRRLGRQPR